MNNKNFDLSRGLIILCFSILLFLISVVSVEAVNEATISLNKTELSLIKGQPGTVQAIVSENTTVHWKTTNPEVVDIVGVSTDSVTTNLMAKGAGTAMIVASMDGGELAFLKVTVKIPVDELRLPQNIELRVGEERMLSAEVLPSNATNKGVEWISDKPGIALVDNNGKVKALGTNGKLKETVEITAVSLDDNTKVAKCSITISKIPVESIDFAQKQLEIVKGMSQNLTPIIKPSTATNLEIKWKSIDETIAKVDNGKVTGLTSGTTTIIATTVDGGYIATSQITVKEVATSQVILNTSATTLFLNGGSHTLKADVVPSSSKNKTILWESSNPAVVSVNANGVITPISTGTAKITASNGESTDVCNVTVQLSSGQARNLSIDRITSSTVELSWTGTIGNVNVELRRKYNNSYVNSSYSSNRSISFSNLSPNTQYTVLVNDQEIGYFTTRRDNVNDDVYDVNLERRSSSSVEINWRGTSGYVNVELRRSSGTYVDSERTSDRRVTFTGLSSSTIYWIYIEDEYIRSFSLDDLDDYNNRDIRYFRITDKDYRSVSAEWDSKNRTVDAEIRRNGRLIDSKRTSSDRVTFTGLESETTYSLYVNGTFMENFTTTKDRFSNEQEQYSVRNFQIKKNYPGKSVELSWSGTSGTVSASIRQAGITIDSKRTGTQQAVFTNIIQNEEYSIYIDNHLVGHFKMGTFSDIENHWAREVIDRLHKYQIISGYEDGSFRANNPLTREEYVTMLVKGLKLSTPKKKEVPFTDIAESRWSAPYISAAISKGILVSSEYSNGRFQPAKGVTREEMAVMTARAMKLTANVNVLSFLDGSVIKNKGLVGALVDKKIINGYPDQTFRPLKTLTRAEGLIVVDKIFKP